MSRDLRPSKRFAFGKYIEEVNVKYWVESVDSCDDKTKMLEHIIIIIIIIIRNLHKYNSN